MCFKFSFVVNVKVFASVCRVFSYSVKQYGSSAKSTCISQFIGNN